MTKLDGIIALIALCGFAVAVGIIVAWVREIDLAIVCIFAVLLAAYDFGLSAFRSVRGGRRRSAAGR
jgi:hypothetical protein